MAVLVRELNSRKAALWAQAEEPERWANGKFPFEILHDLFDDKDGLSFYETETTETLELARIAAALLFPSGAKSCRSPIESVHFRTIGVAEIEGLGLKVSATPGLTKSKVVNELHREVSGITGPSSIELARVMCRNPAAPVSAIEVSRAIARGMIENELPSDCLHKDVLDKMLRDKTARLQWTP